MTSNSGTDAGPLNRKKTILWICLSMGIGAISILLVLAQARTLSLSALLDSFSDLNPFWLTLAIAAMIAYIFLGACAIRCACRALGTVPTLPRSWTYASADLYFSAITPSATGGQPACAWFMIRDGISGAATAAALLLNLAMYTLSILVIGLVSFLLCPRIFLRFGTFSRVLIVIGSLVQLGLGCFYVLLLRSSSLLERIALGVLHLLRRLHLIRKDSPLEGKLRRLLEDYRQQSRVLASKKPFLLRIFLLHVLQRSSQIFVTACSYLALHGGALSAFQIWAMQSDVVLGSTFVPIPGAMAVTDYLMLDGFGSFLAADQAVRLELLSRSLSFYICILLCGLTLLLRLLRSARRRSA